MSDDVVLVLKTALRRWVCRKDETSHPALLSDPDIHALAAATQAGVSEPLSADGGREWGNLRELTKAWLVQQKPGVEPGALQTHDFEYLAALISPKSPEMELFCPVAGPAASEEVPKTDTPLPIEVEIWTQAAPTLVFAREHLERCL